MTRTLLMVGCLAILFSPLVNAEVYQYRDSEGNLRFTDDYMQVPPDQRPDFQPQDAILDAAASGVEPDSADEQANPDTGEDNAGKDGNGAQIEAEVERLKKEQAELAEEYQLLKAETERLKALRESRKTPEEIEKYNAEARNLADQIRAFNGRQKKLADRMKSYFSLIESYNEGVQAMTGPATVE